jgi:hypothetical protein
MPEGDIPSSPLAKLAGLGNRWQKSPNWEPGFLFGASAIGEVNKSRIFRIS